MSDSRISVIVPVYNGAAFLREALLSVLNQTVAPDEIIVVDDGSTDSSAEVVAAFAPLVRYMAKANGGPASARNAGIAAAEHEFLAFIDQDDLWHRAKLERQLACFAEDPRLDLCYAHVDLFWDAALAAEEQAYRDHRRARAVPGYSTPTLLARRSAFERVGPLDVTLRFGDATDWTMRALEAGLRTMLLPDVLLYHRMHPANLTREREPSKREFLRIVRARLQRMRQGAQPEA
ncbi:MAG: glycosyltransferase family A protein [Bauldia sp.]